MSTTTDVVVPQRSGITGIAQSISDGWVMTWRAMMLTIRIPEVLVFSTIQPVMFVVLFAYVFGSSIDVGGGGPDAYRTFLMAGIFVQTVAFTAGATGVGLAEDLHKGIIDRFRSLPISNAAVLVGRTVGDTIRNILTIVIMVLTGLLVGWRIEDGILPAIAGFGILLLFTFTMSWIGAWIGLSVPSPEVANTAGFIWLFPLTFMSNAFVRADNLPRILRDIAEWNPISATVGACRELFGNPNIVPADSAWPMHHPITATLLWCAVILAVFVTLSVRKYARAVGR